MATRRVNAPRRGGFERVKGGFDTTWGNRDQRNFRPNVEFRGWFWQWLLAPYDKRLSPSLIASVQAFVLEIVGSLLLGLIVNTVRANAPGTNVILDAFIIGLSHALSFAFVWGWTPEHGFDLRRHCNRAISIAYNFVGEIGFVTFLGYAAAQFAGAAAAGGILSAAGAGVVPLTTSPLGIAWGYEFLATFAIAFFVVYNDKMEFIRESERENHMRIGYVVSYAILAFTLLGYTVQAYTFGNVIYFAGLVGAGASANSNIGPWAMDWAHYLGTPLAGGAAAGLLYLLIWALGLRLGEKGKVRREEATLYNRGDDKQDPELPPYDAQGKAIRQPLLDVPFRSQ